MAAPSSRDQEPAQEKTTLTDETTESNAEYPGTPKRVAIMVAMYLTMFLIVLDLNIISTAIPRITDEFHSLGDIGWYGSGYLLTTCSFQLIMGKVYKFYPAKPVFLSGVLVFEVGSAICGSAPSSKVFILGRAIAGLGASGLFSGIMVIMFNTIPLQQRPLYQGAFGGVFAICSVIGPLVGGTFTDKVTWRWCFYFNLPVGAVSTLVTFFVLHLPNQKLDTPADGWAAKVKQLDPLGNLVFFPGVVCLVLAFQWGGTEYAWDDAHIIAMLVLCGALFIAFVAIQIWKQEDGTIPPRIVKKRSIAACMFYAFFNGGVLMVMTFYLPIWFQAIKGASATRSGIMLLPTMIATVIGTISAGIIISKVGYYTPFFLLSSVIMPLGAGLISTFTPTTSGAHWIGFQVIFGIGVGFGMQQPMNVIQTVLDRSDIATGAALVGFLRMLASTIFLPVAENIFLSTLVSKATGLPGVDAETITGGGATDLRHLATGDTLEALLSDYNLAIRHVTYLVVATSASTLFGSVFVEWRSLKARAKEDTEKFIEANRSKEKS